MKTFIRILSIVTYTISIGILLTLFFQNDGIKLGYGVLFFGFSTWFILEAWIPKDNFYKFKSRTLIPNKILK